MPGHYGSMKPKGTKKKKGKKKLLKNSGKGKQTNRSGTICTCKS